MTEEGQDLETQKNKPGKSWLFRIGLVLIILAVGLTFGALVFFSSCEHSCGLIFLPIIYIFFPLGLLGLVLTIISYFLKILKRKTGASLFIKIVLVFIIVIISWYGLEIAGGTGPFEAVYNKIGAITKNDFICKLPISGSNERSCYLEVARYKKDPLICDKILINPSFGKYFGYCYQDVALATKNEAICDSPKLDGWQKTYCYSKVAKIKKDETLCDKLTDSDYIEKCYAEVAIVKDTNLCEKIAGNSVNTMTGYKLKDLCISYGKYAKSGDLGFCEPRSYIPIFDTGFYPARRDECVFNAALARNDSTICTEIGDSFKRSVCNNVLR